MVNKKHIQSTLFKTYHVNPYNFFKRIIFDSYLSYNDKIKTINCYVRNDLILYAITVFSIKPNYSFKHSQI